MSPKRRKSTVTSQGSEQGVIQGCPNRKFQLATPTYLSHMLQYGEKGEICNLDIGTRKENMATVKCPRLSGFYWLRAGSGEKVFCFRKTGSLPRISLSVCVREGTRGRQSLGLLLYFLGIRSPPFHCRPIWKRNAQHGRQGLSSCWGGQVDLGSVFVKTSGSSSKARDGQKRWEPVYIRRRVTVHSVAKIASVPEQPRHTPRCQTNPTHGMHSCSVPSAGGHW